MKISALRQPPKAQSPVPKIIERLHADHVNMIRLLVVLQHQASAVVSGRRVEWNIVHGLAAYFRGFVEKFHHPMEDLLFGLLRVRFPTGAMDVFGILEDHHSGARWVRDLETAAEAMELSDKSRNKRDAARITAQERFASEAWNFINRERQHMIREERLYRMAIGKFHHADWDLLKDQMMKTVDPLFSAKAGGRFGKLRAAILTADAGSFQGQ